MQANQKLHKDLHDALEIIKNMNKSTEISPDPTTPQTRRTIESPVIKPNDRPTARCSLPKKATPSPTPSMRSTSSESLGVGSDEQDSTHRLDYVRPLKHMCASALLLVDYLLVVMSTRLFFCVEETGDVANG